MKGVEQDEIERRFLVSGWDDVETWPVSRECFHIKQVYLKSTEEGRSERVRSRISADAPPGSEPTYTWNAKRFIAIGHYAEEEKEIESVDYQQMLWKLPLEGRRPIVKDRWVFDWEGLTWEMDHYTNCHGVVILEVELPSSEAFWNLTARPPFIQIEREITGIRHWSNRSMSRLGWVPFPKLVAGQVWVKGDESFQVLSTENGESGLRATVRKWENPFGHTIGQPMLEPIDVESLLVEGWEPRGA